MWAPAVACTLCFHQLRTEENWKESFLRMCEFLMSLEREHRHVFVLF